MASKLTAEVFSGVWSAMSTPLCECGKVDIDAVGKLVEHEIRLGLKGLFIAGTAGEGPWLADAERYVLARSVAAASRGRLAVAMQITDNSAERMIENIERYKDTGVDMFVIAPPFFHVGATQEFIYELFIKVIEASPLPIGIYNRGKFSSVLIEPDTLAKIISHPKVMLVKDSASQPEYTKVILEVRNRRRGELYAFTGNEFDCVNFLREGYDGLLLGGGCFNGAMAVEIFKLCREGKFEEAQQRQEHMNEVMYRVFGGKDIKCWMAGQKTLMVRLGIFNTARSFFSYKLNDECSREIDAVIAENKHYLLP